MQFKIKQVEIEAKDKEEKRKLEMESLRLVHEEKMNELEVRSRSENDTASSLLALIHLLSPLLD